MLSVLLTNRNRQGNGTLIKVLEKKIKLPDLLISDTELKGDLP